MKSQCNVIFEMKVVTLKDSLLGALELKKVATDDGYHNPVWAINHWYKSRPQSTHAIFKTAYWISKNKMSTYLYDFWEFDNSISKKFKIHAKNTSSKAQTEQFFIDPDLQNCPLNLSKVTKCKVSK